MKTAIEVPDATFRRAKALAAGRGITLKHFFNEALEAQVRQCANDTHAGETDAPWMAGFGELSDLSDENHRILNVIEEEFERLAPEDIA